MTTRDNYHGQGFIQAIEPQVATADVTGATIDTQGFDSCALMALLGASGDTLSASVKVEMEVQHAADDGSGSPDTWAACADDDIFDPVAGTNAGTFAVVDAPAEDEQPYATGYRGSRRFVRLVANLTGTHTNGIEVAGAAILGHPHQSPVN